MRKGIFSELGSAQRGHRLEKEKYKLCLKGSGFLQTVMAKSLIVQGSQQGSERGQFLSDNTAKRVVFTETRNTLVI